MSVPRYFYQNLSNVIVFAICTSRQIYEIHKFDYENRLQFASFQSKFPRLCLSLHNETNNSCFHLQPGSRCVSVD